MEQKKTESSHPSKENRSFGMFYDIWNWILTFHSRAAKARKAYLQEGVYTVADSMPEDVKAIAAAGLPVIWIVHTHGAPITEIIVRLCESYSWCHVSMGAIIQRELILETGREDEIHHLMHRGVAIPRAFIFEIIRRKMAIVCRKKEHKGFIFTDYPSTLSQINELYNHVCKPDFILYVKFSDKLTQENLYIQHKFQVRASKDLRKLKTDVHVVSMEQTKRFKREIEKIYTKYSDIFKVIDTSLSVEDFCRDIMKWIERASVIHHMTPPLFVEPPLQDNFRNENNV